MASLNCPRFVNKVRDDRRHGRVEADHVQHPAVVWVGEGDRNPLTASIPTRSNRIRLVTLDSDTFFLPLETSRRQGAILRLDLRFFGVGRLG